MVRRAVNVGLERRIANHVGIVNLSELVEYNETTWIESGRTKMVQRLTRTNKEMKRSL